MYISSGATFCFNMTVPVKWLTCPTWVKPLEAYRPLVLLVKVASVYALLMDMPLNRQ